MSSFHFVYLAKQYIFNIPSKLSIIKAWKTATKERWNILMITVNNEREREWERERDWSTHGIRKTWWHFPRGKVSKRVDDDVSDVQISTQYINIVKKNFNRSNLSKTKQMVKDRLTQKKHGECQTQTKFESSVNFKIYLSGIASCPSSIIKKVGFDL